MFLNTTGNSICYPTVLTYIESLQGCCISTFNSLFVLTKFVLETPDKIAPNGSNNERCYRAHASPDADGLEVRYAVYHNCNHDYDKEGDTPNLAPIPINIHNTFFYSNVNSCFPTTDSGAKHTSHE